MHPLIALKILKIGVYILTNKLKNISVENRKSLYSLYYQWWKNIDKFLFFLIILLFITGLFFSLVSTSLIVSDKLNTNDYTFFFKHLSFVFLGIIIIFVISSINEEKLFKIFTIFLGQI